MPAYGPLSTLFRFADDRPIDPAETAWYSSRLPRDAGSILQGMCGTGALTLALVESGLSIHGVDASETMLAACNARIEAAGCAAYFFRQNLSALNLPFRYGAAFIADGAFQAIGDRASAIAALSRIRAHFVDPGLLILDMCVPEAAEHPPGAAVVEVRHVTLADGTQMVRRSETSVDVKAQRMEITSRYEHRRGTRVIAREVETLSKAWYGEEQVRALMEAAGYGGIRVEPSPVVDDRVPAIATRFAMLGRA